MPMITEFTDIELSMRQVYMIAAMIFGTGIAIGLLFGVLFLENTLFNMGILP